MHLNNLFYYSLISIAALLSGCATTAGYSTPPLSTEITSQLTTSEPVIAYFKRNSVGRNCDGCTYGVDQLYSSTPVDDGYYRLMLGRNSEGLFLIQDFYQQNKQAQSSPLWVRDPLHVFSLSGELVIGSAMLYYPDGQILAKFNNIDAYNREGEHFYPGGEQASAYKRTASDNVHRYELWYWYKSGKPALHYSFQSQPLSVQSQGWDENGTQTQDNNELVKIRDAIDDVLQENL
jgi:hypothetical protein